LPEPGSEARTLLIACGALAREIRALVAANGLPGLDLVCLPALLHNRPERIPAAVRAKIRAARRRYGRIFVAYADCGTGGTLDRVLAEEGVERISGPHCYAFYAGEAQFAALAEAEPGTFYLTDFLARQFETLVIRGLGLDRHPELLEAYFGNYRRLLYLAQREDPALLARARAAAERLGLAFAWRYTGAGELAAFVQRAGDGKGHGGTGDPLLAGHSGAGDRAGGAPAGEAGAEPALPGGDRPRRDAGRPHRHRRLSRRVAPLDA
jgi:hypothetical protein